MSQTSGYAAQPLAIDISNRLERYGMAFVVGDGQPHHLRDQPLASAAGHCW